MPGIAWVSGEGGTRGLIPTDGEVLFELATGGGPQGEFSVDVGASRLGSSIPEFGVENHPNNPAARPGSSISDYDGIAFPNSQALNEPVWFSAGRPGEARVAVSDVSGDASANAAPDVPEFVDDVVGGGRSVLEFSVENFPNNSPSPTPGESASFQGFGINRGHMGRSFDLVFPTQTAFPEVSGLKIEQDVIEFSPDQAVNPIAIIAPADLNEVDVGHADLLFSESAPGAAGCSVYICGENSPQASPNQSPIPGGATSSCIKSGHNASHLSPCDLIV